MTIKLFRFEAGVEPTQVDQLTTDAKLALVLYELNRRGELLTSPFLQKATKGFPTLSPNTAIWIENQQSRGYSEWAWFELALKFLDGYGKPYSEFKRLEKRLLVKLKVEIEKLKKIETEKAERSKLANMEKNKHEYLAIQNRRKLIGGLGGIHTDSDSSSGYWGRVYSEHWREQD